MKKVMSRREMISVLSDFECKHPGCMSDPGYYDSLEDKPFDCHDVIWAMRDWEEIKDAMHKVCNIWFEWNIPDNKADMHLPDRITINDFCRKYNMPLEVGRNLFKLAKKVKALGEELKELTQETTKENKMKSIKIRQVFTNDDFVRGWNKVSNKNKISKQDQDLIEWAILSRDMEGFEKLCDKYALNDYDRNALAGAAAGAMVLKYGKF